MQPNNEFYNAVNTCQSLSRRLQNLRQLFCISQKGGNMNNCLFSDTLLVKIKVKNKSFQLDISFTFATMRQHVAFRNPL